MKKCPHSRMSVIAEGVETVEQADLLLNLGCAYIQGYLYSKPLPYDEFAKYVLNSKYESINSDVIKQHIDSEEIVHSIVSGTNDVVVVADIKTKRLLYANRAAEKFFNKRFDPIHSTTCIEYCNNPDLCKNCPANNLKKDETKEFFVTDGDKHFKTKYSYIEWNNSSAFVFNQIDITQQMKDFEFSDRLIKNIPGSSVVFEIDKDPKPFIKFVSDQALKLFKAAGLTQKDLKYDDLKGLIYDDDKDHIRSSIFSLFVDKKPFKEKFRVKLINGNIIWLNTLINPVSERDGGYLFYGVINDITDSLKAQEKIENVLLNINIAMTIYEVNEKGINRIFITESAKKLLMLNSDTHERKAVKSLYNRVHIDDREYVKAVTDKCFKEGKEFSIQFRIVSESGEVKKVQIDSKPMVNDTISSSTLFYSIYKDISDLK